MTRSEHRASTLLGAIFVVFGLNGIFRFLPIPLLELTSEGNAFIDLLAASGYFYVVKAVEVIAGLLILTRRHLPLGLAILGPVVFNIFLFHLFLDPRNVAVGIVLLALWGYTVWRYREHFTPLLQPVSDAHAVPFSEKNAEVSPSQL